MSVRFRLCGVGFVFRAQLRRDWYRVGLASFFGRYVYVAAGGRFRFFGSGLAS